MSEAPAELPEGWEWVKLSNVAEINPRRSQKLERNNDVLTTFVPMPAVDDLTGAITAPEVKVYSEVKKGYTYFEEGDVIFAKITPCMQNGKHAVAYNLLDGFAFGSTEFHVIRPGQRVLPEWIHFFVRQPSVLYEAEGRMTGAVGQQRVPKEFLAELEIPLPPLEEQQRVLEALYLQMAEVDKARAATEAQLEVAAKLPKGYLREVFGSTVGEQWPKKAIGEVAQTSSGTTPTRGNPKHFVGSIPWVKTLDLNFNVLYKTEECISTEAFENMGGELLPAGTIMVAMYGGGGTIGKSGILGIEAVTNQAVCSILPNLEVFIPKYLHYWLLYIRPQWMKYSGGNRKDPNINKGIVQRMLCPLPDVATQSKIVDALDQKMQHSTQLVQFLQIQLETINALPASLLRQAFSGELTRQPSPEALRAALACLAVERLHHRVFFGVVQLMKVLYFAQAYLNIPLGYTIRRHTHGPFDKAVYDLEKEGERQGWFSVDKAVDKQGSRYIPSAELSSQVREAERTLDRWKGELDGLLELAESFDTTGLEALATLHAAWNDLLLEGRQPTDGEIISEVLECWPGKAEKFSRGELRQYLAYLKTTPYRPIGTGQSTRLTHAA